MYIFSIGANKMYKFYILVVVSIFISNGEGQHNDNMIGKGKWSVLSVSKCDNPDQYPVQIEVRRTKMGRYLDAFSALIQFNFELDSTYAAKVTVEKEADGGAYKLYQEIADESFCNFVNKYAKSNFENALSMLELDPPNCPMPAGEYNLENFLFDYDEMPAEAVYGKFKVLARLVKDNEEIGCVLVDCEFKEENEDDE